MLPTWIFFNNVVLKFKKKKKKLRESCPYIIGHHCTRGSVQHRNINSSNLPKRCFSGLPITFYHYNSYCSAKCASQSECTRSTQWSTEKNQLKCETQRPFSSASWIGIRLYETTLWGAKSRRDSSTSVIPAQSHLHFVCLGGFQVCWSVTGTASWTVDLRCEALLAASCDKCPSAYFLSLWVIPSARQTRRNTSNREATECMR